MEEKVALQKCADWCLRRERCTAEVAEKLRSWDVAPDIVDKIVDQLVEDRFVDNARFATYYARDKARFNNWGPFKIKYHLAAKHIDKATIEEAISAVEEHIFEASLQKALESKIKSEKKQDIKKLKDSLFRLAISRGFSYDIIQSRIEQILTNETFQDN